MENRAAGSPTDKLFRPSAGPPCLGAKRIVQWVPHALATRVAVVVFLVAYCIAPSARAADVRGFAELRSHHLVGVEGKSYQFVQLVRPDFSAPLTDRVTLSATVEASLSQGRDLGREVERSFRQSDLWPALEEGGCHWSHPDNRTMGISSSTDYLGVERLYLDTYTPSIDLRLGRQAVNWGSAFLVNPTDPFPEVLLTEPWRARRGVNAARATVRMGLNNQLQAVLGLDDSLRHLRVASRATVRLATADLSISAAWREEAHNGLLGVDLRGNMGVGYWLEGAVHMGRDTRAREEVAAGVDYSLPVMDNLVIRAQYYRNGRGDTAGSSPALSQAEGALPVCGASECGPALATNGAFTRGAGEARPDPFAPFFRGRDYAMLSAALYLNPEASLSALWIQNLGDGGGLLVPVITHTPNGWLELSAAAQISVSPWGNGGELNPRDEDFLVQVSSEEGSTGSGNGAVVDLKGLVPDATLITWARMNF